MGKVIAVTNQKGGVGKTTVAVNLGVGLAREGKKVLDISPECSRIKSRNLFKILYVFIIAF